MVDRYRPGSSVPRKILFPRPRLKIRARLGSLRKNEHDETEGDYRGDNARSCAD